MGAGKYQLLIGEFTVLLLHPRALLNALRLCPNPSRQQVSSTYIRDICNATDKATPSWPYPPLLLGHLERGLGQSGITRHLLRLQLFHELHEHTLRANGLRNACTGAHAA